MRGLYVFDVCCLWGWMIDKMIIIIIIYVKQARDAVDYRNPNEYLWIPEMELELEDNTRE